MNTLIREAVKSGIVSETDGEQLDKMSQAFAVQIADIAEHYHENHNVPFPVLCGAMVTLVASIIAVEAPTHMRRGLMASLADTLRNTPFEDSNTEGGKA